MTMRLLQKTGLVFFLFGSAFACAPWLATNIFELPKFIFIAVATALLSIVNIFDYIFKAPATKLRYPPAYLCFLILFLIGHVVAYLFSTDPATSLLGSPVRLQGLVTQLLYILFGLNAYYILKSVQLDQPKNILFVFKSLVIFLILSSTFALLPYLSQQLFGILDPKTFLGRAYGTFGNPNYLAAYIVTLLPILIILWRELFRSSTAHKLFWPSLVLVLAALFATGSRASWLAALFGFSIWGAYNFFRRGHKKIVVMVVCALLFLLVGFAFKNQLTPYIPLFNRFTLDTPETSSIQSRFTMWRAGLRMGVTRPFTGFGQDAIAGHIDAFLPPHLRANDIFFVDRVHNEFIDIFAATGLITLVGYLGLIITLCYQGFKQFHNHNNMFAGAATLAIIILVAFQAINFSTISSSVLLALLLAYLAASSKTTSFLSPS